MRPAASAEPMEVPVQSALCGQEIANDDDAEQDRRFKRWRKLFQASVAARNKALELEREVQEELHVDSLQLGLKLESRLDNPMTEIQNTMAVSAKDGMTLKRPPLPPGGSAQGRSTLTQQNLAQALAKLHGRQAPPLASRPLGRSSSLPPSSLKQRGFKRRCLSATVNPGGKRKERRVRFAEADEVASTDSDPSTPQSRAIAPQPMVALEQMEEVVRAEDVAQRSQELIRSAARAWHSRYASPTPPRRDDTHNHSGRVMPGAGLKPEHAAGLRDAPPLSLSASESGRFGGTWSGPCQGQGRPCDGRPCDSLPKGQPSPNQPPHLGSCPPLAAAPPPVPPPPPPPEPHGTPSTLLQQVRRTSSLLVAAARRSPLPSRPPSNTASDAQMGLDTLKGEAPPTPPNTALLKQAQQPPSLVYTARSTNGGGSQRRWASPGVSGSPSATQGFVAVQYPATDVPMRKPMLMQDGPEARAAAAVNRVASLPPQRFALGGC
mmetsp:Transcript_68993/g.128861  ORF Transcript_68993/g.128861 Transcript_68993/m.128861 type:complete len:492 (+) Transcript_68993:80-1555(+)